MKKQLKVKFGIDPTSPDLHLGHAVPLKKLRQFQDAGHKAVLIIGDFTAQIGDPSGRAEARKPLTKKEVKNNLKKYLSLAGKIIDIKKAKIVYNSKWLRSVDILLKLAQIGSVQELLHRSEFRARVAQESEIKIIELMYPLFQGYDSVVVEADVEIGGVDQELNLLMGRKLQRVFGQPEQDIVKTPLLIGTDGVKKMSKSFGNYIALDEKPDEMFAKIMTVPDAQIKNYFHLLTDLDLSDIKLETEPVLEQKKILACEIVAWLHSRNAAKKARGYFEKTFSKKEIPKNLKIYRAQFNEKWANFLVREKLAHSRSEAKRLIEGGGLDFNGRKIARASEQISESGTVKIGKHKFIKIDVCA